MYTRFPNKTSLKEEGKALVDWWIKQNHHSSEGGAER